MTVITSPNPIRVPCLSSLVYFLLYLGGLRLGSRSMSSLVSLPGSGEVHQFGTAERWRGGDDGGCYPLVRDLG